MFFVIPVSAKKDSLSARAHLHSRRINIEDMGEGWGTQYKHTLEREPFFAGSITPRQDTINIDEEGEGVELSVTCNAFGNLFSQTPV